MAIGILVTVGSMAVGILVTVGSVAACEFRGFRSRVAGNFVFQGQTVCPVPYRTLEDDTAVRPHTDPTILVSPFVAALVVQVDCISTLDAVRRARHVGGQMHTDIRMCHDRCSQNYYRFLACPLLL
jgi:hypothetical protein